MNKGNNYKNTSINIKSNKVNKTNNNPNINKINEMNQINDINENNNDKNIIDEIELRLQELEKEKDQIEDLYGINEDVLNEYTNNKIINKANNDNYKEYNSKINTLYNKTATNQGKLPKLQASEKKEMKSSYKIPETLQESLKYEPSIKDLLDEEEFEPSYTNLNSLKIHPSIPGPSDISNYIDFINREYNENYIK